VKIPFAVFRVWQAGAAALPAAPRHREWLGRNVEAQIALGAETPAGRIAERLISEGLDRHDAIHAIGMVLAEHIYDVLKTTKSHKDPNAPYFAALELTAEDWGAVAVMGTSATGDLLWMLATLKNAIRRAFA
jgi:hypothetical protein